MRLSQAVFNQRVAKRGREKNVSTVHEGHDRLETPPSTTLAVMPEPRTAYKFARETRHANGLGSASVMPHPGQTLAMRVCHLGKTRTSSALLRTMTRTTARAWATPAQGRRCTTDAPFAHNTGAFVRAGAPLRGWIQGRGCAAVRARRTCVQRTANSRASQVRATDQSRFTVASDRFSTCATSSFSQPAPLHAAVRQPRAGARRAGQHRHRHLQPGCAAVCAAHRPAALWAQRHHAARCRTRGAGRKPQPPQCAGRQHAATPSSKRPAPAPRTRSCKSRGKVTWTPSC